MTALREGGRTVSLCALRLDGALFGIETRDVRKVLRKVTPQRVPLAPSGIAGLVMDRGEVLTIVSLRSLLGLKESEADTSVLVMEGTSAEEQFGLAVEVVEGVMEVPESSLEPNPSTLDTRSSRLFDGAYRTAKGLVVRLNAAKLTPGQIAADEDAERRDQECYGY